MNSFTRKRQNTPKEATSRGDGWKGTLNKAVPLGFVLKFYLGVPTQELERGSLLSLNAAHELDCTGLNLFTDSLIPF